MSNGDGVFTREIPTSITPPAQSNSSLVMAFGCAPIHRLPYEDQRKAKPGEIVMITNVAGAAQQLGIDVAKDNPDKWGLSWVAFNQFVLYGNAPVIFANLFNPDIHRHEILNETLFFDDLQAKLLYSDVIGDLNISCENTENVFIYGEDYLFEPNSGIIDVIPGSSLAGVINRKEIIVSYSAAAPEMVSNYDCVGGFDTMTGQSTGIELVEQAFPRFRQIPSILLAPNHSTDPMVQAVLAAKTTGINGVFSAIAIVDAPAEISLFSDVPRWKNDNNITSENLYVCWPRVKFGDRSGVMSAQVAGIMGKVDRQNNGIPFESPANLNLQCQSVVTGRQIVNLQQASRDLNSHRNAEQEVWLDLTQANLLIANGITTALNFSNGWVLWGNWTAAYPANTDSKDAFISSRRMLNWLKNNITLSHFRRSSRPMNRRLIQTIINSEQANLNGLMGVGALLHGSTITFSDEFNPLIDMMSGIIKYHLSLGLVLPARRIEFLFEYNPNLMETLLAG